MILGRIFFLFIYYTFLCEFLFNSLNKLHSCSVQDLITWAFLCYVEKQRVAVLTYYKIQLHSLSVSNVCYLKMRFVLITSCSARWSKFNEFILGHLQMLQEIITETKHSQMDLKQWVKKAAKVVAEILAFQGN